VLGLGAASHAEYGAEAASALIAPVACGVSGRPAGAPALSGSLKVKLAGGSRVAAIYGRAEIEEEVFCNYELNPASQGRFTAGELSLVGFGEQGEVRIVELPGRSFYLATLFLPQLASTERLPHPVVVAFLRAAAQFAASRSARSLT